MKELEGKVALITGGARGQGRTHALALARQGAAIVVTDLHEEIDTVPYALARKENLEETVSLVEAEDVRCLAITADVRSSAQMDEAVAKAVAELGSVDILCANAGIWAAAEITEMSDAQWQNVIDTNITGVFNSIRPVAKQMVAQGTGGRIVATASVVGRAGAVHFGNYAAAKWGVIGLVKTAALELAPHRITVNAICPATVKTDMCFENKALYEIFRPDLEEPSTADVEEAILTMHKIPDPWIEPEEISDLVVFLASERAKHISGTAIDLAAGLNATWGS